MPCSGPERSGGQKRSGGSACRALPDCGERVRTLSGNQQL
jgi:hypothetical protein